MEWGTPTLFVSRGNRVGGYEMKTDFMIALTQLAAERNLPSEVILRAIETALVYIFKKNSFTEDQNITVKIMSQTGEVRVYVRKTVVEKPEDPGQEIPLSEARKLKKDIQIGETVDIESTPKNAGRIAAQAAKQIILQRLREVERDTIFGEYADKEGDVVSGVVRYVEPNQVIIDLGRAEALLPIGEQVNTEHYRVGQRLKLYLTKVLRTSKGTQLIVSRTHINLLRRLFELEVPEIYNGTVELRALAREPGHRSKIAVSSQQEGVDAIGCCVGLRSIRIQNVTKELNEEKIDIIQWHSDPAVFIANALSPATVVKVEINGEEKSANVVVNDRQLSLAIGRGGQNARLAARLTGWRIDIKSLSMEEAERAEKAPPAEEAPTEVAVEEKPVEMAVEAAPETVSEPEPVAEEITPILEEAEELISAPAEVEAPVAEEVGQTRRTYSVEEILSELDAVTESLQRSFGGGPPAPRSVKPDIKVKKGKQKGPQSADLEQEEAKPKKAPKRRPIILDEDSDTDEDILSELESVTEDLEADSDEEEDIQPDAKVKKGKQKGSPKAQVEKRETKATKTHGRRSKIQEEESDTD